MLHRDKRQLDLGLNHVLVPMRTAPVISMATGIFEFMLGVDFIPLVTGLCFPILVGPERQECAVVDGVREHMHHRISLVFDNRRHAAPFSDGIRERVAERHNLAVFHDAALPRPYPDGVLVVTEKLDLLPPIRALSHETPQDTRGAQRSKARHIVPILKPQLAMFPAMRIVSGQHPIPVVFNPPSPMAGENRQQRVDASRQDHTPFMHAQVHEARRSIETPAAQEPFQRAIYLLREPGIGWAEVQMRR